VDTGYTTQTGWLCLDFANTVGWHASTHPEEHLNSYADLVGWAEKATIVTTETAGNLTKMAAKEPAEAGRALREAKKIRDAIYKVLAAHAHGEDVPAADLAAISEAAVALSRHSRLVVQGTGFAWQLTAAEDELDIMLWPVVRSALELMTGDGLERVGQCADADGCGWLFWDTSRNKSRRWCDMGDCGNRAKVRRYYDRQKKQA
jgi:predicted RNA-binding Zn ribbon-like protein